MSSLSLDNAAAAFLRTKSAAEVRSDLLARREIALLDVREEAHHAQGHPLFAANLPLSRIELEAFARLPRRTTPIVVLDDGEGLARRAAERLLALGYSDVKLLAGGLSGWCNAGYEVFRDVNAPSKAFGELVEAERHTPSLSAQEVKALIDAKADVVIVDARRFDEFHTMSIPTATSVPGAELVLRVRDLAPDPATRVIVNCAGRTRSIIGTQSLINAGLPNPVAALRNGTIGWTLARQELDRGAVDTFPDVRPDIQTMAAASARRVADQAGVARADLATIAHWIEEDDRTVYCFDVRTPEEYATGHLPGFRGAPGGQLVQETDVFAPVRGAKIVLVDDDGVRANMTASWLAQMAWEVAVLDGLGSVDFSECGARREPLPDLPPIPQDAWVGATRLHDWLEQKRESALAVLDFAPSRLYEHRHIPGAWFALRSQLAEALDAVPGATRYVLTSPDGIAAHFAWREAVTLASQPVHLLDGGTDAWIASGFRVDALPKYASQPIDRYRRPYEGTDAPPSAIEAYLDWEYGLVEQLHRDGTHGFRVI